MQPDLDSLKNELPPYLESRGVVIFHGESRLTDDGSVVMWDVEKRPDFREFIECSQRLGVKVIVLQNRVYMFEARSEFMNDLLSIMSDIDLWMPAGEDSEEEDPMTGGFFSRN